MGISKWGRLLGVNFFLAHYMLPLLLGNLKSGQPEIMGYFDFML
jgi:hypothetical protein